jgi:excisionase family DNA binding protein
MKLIEPSVDEVMDYKGLSVYLKLSQGTLRHKVMNGEIPFYKVGFNVRFSKKHIDAWLEEHHQRAKRKQVKELTAVDGEIL